ncbi:MAG: conjugal transfer protein TraA [Rhizobiales bacterium]|nr:conjugal transfer protein TraA [Hyphomicrobiales bacterium]
MEFFFGAFTDAWERRKAALLHERSLGRRRDEEDEERRRGGRSDGWPEGGGALGFGPGTGASRRQPRGTAAGSRPMRARFSAIAKGSQPAVVKMASYGGGVRLGAMMNYVSRAGEVEVEDDRGEQIRSRERLSSLRSEWEHLFQNREESRDIGVFSVAIGGVPDYPGEELHALVRARLTQGLGDRRFAYAIERQNDGSLAISGVVVLRGHDGERLTGDAKATGILQERYDTRSTSDDPSVVFSFDGYGNGVDYGTARLRRLVERFEGDVHDERGIMIENDSVAGDLVQKDWRHELHSRKSRDVMHLIMSARAGTDVDAFKDAARDFLAEQFPGHRYVFALHDPAEDPKDEAEGGKRPHVHAHAIITMKSEFGERIATSPQVFRQWRSLMAEKAREHGIDMEMTDRRELATAPAFGRNQVRPVSRLGRTEHVGTSEAAHARYAAKRSERATVARARRSMEYTEMARQAWGSLVYFGDDRDVASFAKMQQIRLETAFSRHDLSASLDVASANFGSKYRANMVWLQAIVSEADKMREMSRPEFEAYERRVETALFRFERLIGSDERADFDEIALAAREHVNVRREILELNEERRSIDGLEHAQSGKAASTSADAGEDERRLHDERDVQSEVANEDVIARGNIGIGTAAEHSTQRRTQAPERGRDPASKPVEPNRNDPPQQRIPRLDELDREEQERKDRDRDDFER